MSNPNSRKALIVLQQYLFFTVYNLSVMRCTKIYNFKHLLGLITHAQNPYLGI